MNYACDTKSKTLKKIKIDGKWGYIDQCASLVIKPLYGDAFPFSEGLAVVRVEPWGAMGLPPPFSVINDQGETIISQFDALPHWSGFSDGLLRVSLGKGKHGVFFLDKTGENPFEGHLFEKAGPFSTMRASVSFGSLSGYINPIGEMVIGADYYWAHPFTGGYAMVMKSCGKKMTIINTQGHYQMEPNTELQFGSLWGLGSNGT